MIDQLKGAGDLMKNLSPQQIAELMKQAPTLREVWGQAGDAKRMMEEAVRKILDEEIKARNLISRDEVMRILDEKK